MKRVLFVVFVIIVMMSQSNEKQLATGWGGKPQDTEVSTLARIEVETVKPSGIYMRGWKFVLSYGGKIDQEYYDELYNYCRDDYIREVVAISVSETGMGSASSNRTNFYGWFKGGNRRYDPSKREMSREICNGIRNYYPSISKGVGVERYTGGSDDWYSRFMWAYSQI